MQIDDDHCSSDSQSGTRSHAVSEWTMPIDPSLAIDALFGLLLPLWQLVIGVLVLVAVVVSVGRLAQRGPSRMSAAMLLIGAAVVCLAVFGYLFQGL
jgi:hypothetical protein